MDDFETKNQPESADGMPQMPTMPDVPDVGSINMPTPPAPSIYAPDNSAAPQTPPVPPVPPQYGAAPQTPPIPPQYGAAPQTPPAPPVPPQYGGYNPPPQMPYQPYQQPPVYNVPQQNKTLAIVSLVTGIISIVCCCSVFLGIPFSIASVITGIVSLKKNAGGRGMAIAGIICGSAGVLLALIMLILAATGNMEYNVNFPSDYSDYFSDY